MNSLQQKLSQKKEESALQMREAVLPLLFDEKQAAAYCGMSLSSLRKGRCLGKTGGRTPMPPFVKFGKRVMYRRSDLDLWVAALETRATI